MEHAWTNSKDDSRKVQGWVKSSIWNSRFGESFGIAEESKEMMEQAGFVNAQRHTFKWPIGTWPMDKEITEIGAYNRFELKGLMGGRCF